MSNRRAERSEPILPSRDLDETRVFYEAIGQAAGQRVRGWLLQYA